MTEEELRAGMCQDCDTLVEAPKAKPAPTPEAKAQAQDPPLFTIAMLVGLSLSFVAFCLLPVGLMVYFSLSEPTAEKTEKSPAVKPKPFAKAKTTPEQKTTAAETETKNNDIEIVKDKQDKEQPKKTDVKKEEVKKEEIKKEEVKKEPKKIDEPKVVEKKPAPIEKKQRFMTLAYLHDDAIKIDGDLADWKDVPPISLQGVELGRVTKKIVASPKTQKAYVAYSKRGIVIGLDVVDTSGELENAAPAVKNTSWGFWDNDGIEVFIDTLNQRPGERGDPNLHQFFAFPFGIGNDDAIGGYESRMLKPAGRLVWSIVPQPGVGKTGMLRAGKKTPTGWTMELLIPKSSLRQGDLKPGQSLGFEMQLDTGTNLFYFWANDNNIGRVSTNPSRWGEALLAGTDASIDLMANGKPAKAMLPGQPLSVRVTDLDVSMNVAARQKVNVTLVSKSGDRKTLLLVETALGSSIFAGTIATRPNTGKRDPNVLEVLAEDVITIEYLDLFRANGERNKLVTATMPIPGP